MKKTLSLIGVAGLSVAIAVCASRATEQSPYQVIQKGPVSSAISKFTPTLGSNSLSGVTNKIPLKAGSGLGVSFPFTLSGNQDSNVFFNIKPSVDGTNALGYSIARVGAKGLGPTNVYLAATNFTAAQLSGFKALFVGVENSAPGTFSNNGALYNWDP